MCAPHGFPPPVHAVVASMSLLTVALAGLAVGSPAELPRDCPYCGLYAGPNAFLVLDPYLRRVDTWPEFYESTCSFEIARGAFVTLSRTACASEITYRSGRR